MELIDAIMTRRSIRRYTSEKVSDKQLETILKAAMFAPSASNRQPWHFIVIDEKERLLDLTRLHPYAKALEEAPMAILVCGDEELSNKTEYWVQDCSAATQNILLAAHALGLGTVWLGVHPKKERIDPISKYFGLPETIHPLSLIALGHPSETPSTQDRFRKDRIRHNTW